MKALAIKSAQTVLGWFGVRMTRVPSCIEPLVPFDVLELAIVSVQKKMKDDFYFVQIGANDGILHDFLNPLIQRYELKGCLVEPMPDVFEILKKNYADQPQLEFRNVIIGKEDGFGVLHRFRRDANVPKDFFHGLARQDGNYIRNRAEQEGLTGSTEELTCPMQTFASFHESIGLRRIDLLYVDTEGSDDVVLQSAFAAGIRPRIVQYEWSEMSLERRYQLKLLLLEEGYQFLDVGSDTVCLRARDDD